MKRIAIILTLVWCAGCGGDKPSSEENRSGDQSAVNQDGKTANSTAGSDRPDAAAEEQAKKQPGGSRVRTKSFFGAGKLTADMNLMKQMAIAIHTYHDVNRCFAMYPQGVNGGPANDKLSWRVKVLPDLELQNLFEEFDLQQPWDSEKNKPLIKKGLAPFRLSNGNLICAILHDKQPKSFRDIVDGSSNTIMLIENPNADAEQWSQPKDISKQDAVKLLKSLKKGEFILGLMYDGSVHRIYSPEGKGLSDKELEAAFDYKDLTPLHEKFFE